MIDESGPVRCFNGHALEEQWPTIYRRELVAGPYRVKVRPQDDMIYFDTDTVVPPRDQVLFAFFASLPSPGSD